MEMVMVSEGNNIPTGINLVICIRFEDPILSLLPRIIHTGLSQEPLWVTV